MAQVSAVLFFLFYTLICHVICYPQYRDKIPNGMKVPHPCKKNSVWDGVGHLAWTGGGKRNPFGDDFAANGHDWSKVCKLDSDGDGKSNGDELGDPLCQWREGQPHPKAALISHPGVCEPVDSPRCTNQKWISCTGTKQKCPAINETGVREFDVRFPHTLVPPRETSYYCKTFELPHDQPYHIVASDPLLNNTLVIHHMILYGCEGNMTIEKEPFNCIMGSAKCQEMLAGWTVGEEGECLHYDAGMRFGKGSFRYVQLQVHWTNTGKAPNWYDSSGLKLYYTPKLRKNDLGVLTTGQTMLEIPPLKKVTLEGVCKPECTRTMLKTSVNVTGASLHAHFLGVKMVLEQWRNGTKLRDLARDEVFSYNNPTSTLFNPPVVLEPGDKLKTKCTYDSSGNQKRDKWTYYGDGTFDEMCFGFVNYYPKINGKINGIDKQYLCVSFDRYDFCDIYTAPGGFDFYKKGPYGQCDLNRFDALNFTEKVNKACTSTTNCTMDCKRVIHAMDQQRCMKGYIRKIYDGIMYLYDRNNFAPVWAARKSCEFVKLPTVQPSATSTTPSTTPGPQQPSSASLQMATAETIAFTLLITFAKLFGN